MTSETIYIGTTIAKSKDSVYHYVSNPENFPEWLAFVESISRKSGRTWTAQTSLGEITIDFLSENPLGVVDHTVTLADGSQVYNPLRVIENGDGSEVVFTLFRLPGRTKEEFEQDAGMVRKDLATLKAVLEK